MHNFRKTLPSSIKNETIILICDGHNSRQSLEGLLVLKRNNIRLLTIPSHTSHVLQPFDISIAGPLKNDYIKKFNINQKKFNEDAFETKISYYRFLAITSIYDSFKATSSIINIAYGFKSSGIYPFSVEQPLSSRFIHENYQNEFANVRNNSFSGCFLTDDNKILEIGASLNIHKDNLDALQINYDNILYGRQKCGKLLSTFMNS